MLFVTAPYQGELHTHIAVQDEDSAWLQRQAHTLRLEGDYVGAQWLERSLRQVNVGGFMLPLGMNLGKGQNV